MIQAILLDLDDTLLGNDMDSFMPAYFDLISQYASGIMEKKRFLRELMVCTQAVIENTCPNQTNRQVFWQVFQERNQLDPEELEPFFNRFYYTEFNQLIQVVQPKSVAPKLVAECFDLGLQVVIATNPLFPRPAIEARLEWAGVPVSQFDYALVTTYENMHATKPHQAYYREILHHIGCAPDSALMVGDSLELDIVPAAEIGMHTYWVTPSDNEQMELPPTSSQLGTLDDLFSLIQNGWLQKLAPA